MSRRYRCIALACLGWLTLTGQHIYPLARAEQTQARDREADALEKIAATYNEQTERKERPPKHDPCGPYQYGSDSELCAAWKSADATRDAAWWAVVGSLLNLLGLMGVSLALVAAYRANAIARDTAKRQLRAYFSVSAVTQDQSKPGQWKMQVEWINTGQTPAKNVMVSSDWRDFPQGIPDNFDFPGQFLIDGEGPAAVGPGQPLYGVCDRRLPLWMLPKVAQRQAMVALWASADYTDVFGKMHRTEFAARLSVEHLQDDQYGSTWNAIHRHNGIEDDCRKPPYSDYPKLKPVQKRLLSGFRTEYDGKRSYK